MIRRNYFFGKESFINANFIQSLINEKKVIKSRTAFHSTVIVRKVRKFCLLNSGKVREYSGDFQVEVLILSHKIYDHSVTTQAVVGSSGQMTSQNNYPVVTCNTYCKPVRIKIFVD